MTDVVLGPMLRYVDGERATVWVETDGPSEVAVLVGEMRHTTATFHVEGHHYALVTVTELRPGTVTPYRVTCDGEPVWPRPHDDLPAPVIPTPDGERARLVFGSCRAAAPNRPPWNLDYDDDPHGRGPDALVAYAARLRETPHEDWPDLLLLLGDQVYADDASPRTRRFIRRRRDTDAPPGEEVAGFEEYTRLYQETWSDPDVRWLLSTVPTAMMFDDHDITDDWNISGSWIAEMRDKPWWDERIVGGLMAYWCYQQLGNLSPEVLAEDALWEEVRAADDAGSALRRFVFAADRDPGAARWAYARHLGPVHLVVTDARAARTFADGRRDMLDPDEWDWLTDRLAEPTRHLLLASTVPVLLPHTMHHVEAWNEQLCAGAWGGSVAWASERLRRAIDLEHWPAFATSFDRLVDLLADVARRGDGLASVAVLAGDVHNATITRGRFTDPTARLPLWQVVSSPLRQEVEPAVEKAYSLGASRVAKAVARRLARWAGVRPPAVDWEVVDGPVFDHHVATVEADAEHATARIEALTGRPRVLRTVAERDLTAG